MSASLDAAMRTAIRDGMIPGGVLIVGHDGRIVHRKAYGDRAMVPRREAMTLDTIFDIASLTKVVATTPALMKLFEQGKIRMTDPVTAYLPEFQGGHSDITVRDLMTHFSGLRPDLDRDPPWSGYETGIQRALIDKPAGPAGTRFVYSDINFICSAKSCGASADSHSMNLRANRFSSPLACRRRCFGRLNRCVPGSHLPRSTRPPRFRFAASYTTPPRAPWAASRDMPVFFLLLTISPNIVRCCWRAGKRAVDVFFLRSPCSDSRRRIRRRDQAVLRGLGWDIDSPTPLRAVNCFPSAPTAIPDSREIPCGSIPIHVRL